ncbi:mobilization protein [Helicobacter monodelphidis]|uniref:mobilization protein n=1 Tax=Helicobacter sp. 15-1451 TaxID=2004995 RepID=UPI000DCD3827|nr:mobilization protein [Helicobacter sp. 15-1451]RAX56398.1 mobilization protein [Helicobacter sp. 15-1451]
MSKIASAHCNPKIKPVLNHNDRTNNNAKTITKEYSYLNEYSCKANEVRATIENLYQQAYNNFYSFCEQKNGLSKNSGKPKGLQNFTKKEKCYHEFIYEIDKNTTMLQCQELTETIANITGFTPLQIAIHRDERFTDKNGNEQTHYHAHAVFFTLDRNTGLQLARQEASLNKSNLSKIQSFASQIFKMKRGEPRYSFNEKQPKYIQDYKVYAQFKEQEKLMEQRILEQQRNLDSMTQILLQEQEQARIQKEYYESKIRDLERGHQLQLDKLEKEFDNRKSIWKNIVTFGKHNEKVENDYNITKTAFLSSANEAKKNLQNRINDQLLYIEKLESDKKELSKKYELLKTDFEKTKDRLTKLENWCENNLSSNQLQEIFPEKSREQEKSNEQTLDNLISRYSKSTIRRNRRSSQNEELEL